MTKISYAAAARATMLAAAPHAVINLRDRPYGLSLSLLSVPTEYRRTGQATAALQALTRHADALGITLSLTPDAGWGTPSPVLYRLYMAHGFIPNRGHESLDTMVRYPVE